ncbi:MAG: YdcF family protein [Cyanobacteria bacterium LVE1205-1]
MIYLHKILPIFILPTGWIVLSLLMSLMTRRLSLVWFTCFFFWLCSTPFISDRLIAAVENHQQRLDPKTMPAVEAIVVLSGMLHQPPGFDVPEWTEASDRFWGGLELYQDKKAPRLIFTGGWMPWQPNRLPEGQQLKTIALTQGISMDAITVTEKVSNTAAEAKAVYDLLKKPNPQNPPQIILVTSAFHMVRARRLFEQAGCQVTPYPVDFYTHSPQPLTILDFLPNAHAFQTTELAWREFIGRFYYDLIRSQANEKSVA